MATDAEKVLEAESFVTVLTEALDAALDKRDRWTNGESVAYEGTLTGQMAREIVRLGHTIVPKAKADRLGGYVRVDSEAFVERLARAMDANYRAGKFDDPIRVEAERVANSLIEQDE